MPLYRGMSHDNLALSVHAPHQYSRNNGVFGRQYNIYNLARTPKIGQGLGRILSCGACKPEHIWTKIEFIKPVFHNAIGWCFIAKQKSKFINALLS